MSASLHACKSTCKHFSIPCKDEGHLRLLSLIPPPPPPTGIHFHGMACLGDPALQNDPFPAENPWSYQRTHRIFFSDIYFYSLLRSMPHLQSCEAQEKCFITVTCALRGNYLLTFVTQISQKLTFYYFIQY
jgi:hypothetical protein